VDCRAQIIPEHLTLQEQASGHARRDVGGFSELASDMANSDQGAYVKEQQTSGEADLLRPRGRVTTEELALMPASLKASEAQPWARLSRSAFYAALRSGDIASCHLGHSIRIPTRRFLKSIGVLDETETGD
jgi:hypothetical protein